METLLGKLATRAMMPAKWLIVLGMAYTLATTVLFIAAPQEAASVQPEAPLTADARNSGPGAADLDAIIAANLFGVARAAPAEAAVASATAESLVETRLPLVLHGVFVAEIPAESTAIVARKGRPEELIRIGERVPGNATLESVYLDHVLLRRGRSLERLAFPDSDRSIATPSPRPEPARAGSPEPRAMPGESVPEPALSSNDPPPPSAMAAQHNPGEGSPRELAERYRDRLKADPRGALGELGLTPVGGDGPGGYRLDRLSRSPYLRQTGLKPGDVVLSINGQPLGDVGRDRLELDNVLAQGSARLEIQRGERRFFITASLPHPVPEQARYR